MATISQAPSLIAEALWYEKAVLGTLLSEPSLASVIFAKVDPEIFYDPQHARIFFAALDQRNAGEPIDPISIYDRLKPMSFRVLAEIVEYAMPGSIEYWIEKMVDAAARRKAQDVLQGAMDSLGQFDIDLVANFQNMSDEVIKLVAPRGGVETIQQGLIETLKNIENRHERKIVRTGLASLDMLVGGFFPGQFWVVAGRTSMGKSSLSQNMMLAIARAGNAVGYMSIEGDNDELRMRLLSIESGVTMSDLSSGDLSDSQTTQITAACGVLGAMPIYYVDKERIWSKVKAKIQLLKFRDPRLTVAFVDYIGLIDHPQYKNRWEAIAAVSRDMKALALSMGIALVAVCQINRETEKRRDHRPTLADLRDAGAIEQDADVICLLYRPSYYDRRADPTAAEIAVAKQRNGPTGAIEIGFQSSCIRFFDR